MAPDDAPAPIDLRDAPAPVRLAALGLNAEHVAETSPLDAAALDALLAAASLAPARADGRAFLIAMGPGAAYASPNYAWVAARYPAFLYVDRVIVGAELRGLGIGRALYGTVFARAAALGVPVLCEVNREPPNPGSDAFHARLGFAEVGHAVLGPGKSVRYLCRTP